MCDELDVGSAGSSCFATMGTTGSDDCCFVPKRSLRYSSMPPLRSSIPVAALERNDVPFSQNEGLFTQSLPISNAVLPLANS